jgi:hypothetical protein
MCLTSSLVNSSLASAQLLQLPQSVNLWRVCGVRRLSGQLDASMPTA